MPDFRDPQFLLDHIRHTMAFYHPRAIDPRGGFFHFFRDDGSVYDAHTRHLVSSTRFVFNYAMAYRRFRDSAYLRAAEHGTAYLRDRHRNASTGGYAWLLDADHVADATNHCYGLAFVLLAYAHASMAGVEPARAWIGETFDLMERKFWSPASGLYADEAAADWSVDWDFNKHDKTNIFRPWGYQPGHLAEWAKLLLILERHADRLTGPEWLAPRAAELFDAAIRSAWDNEHGGLVYGFAPDGSICDGDKYFWVQAESLAAAALLAKRTGDEKYWKWYERIWEYSWKHFVDHEHGAWYRILAPDNRKYSDEKSPAGKTDYHTMGACYEVLNAIGT